MSRHKIDFNRPLVWESKDQYVERFASLPDVAEGIKNPLRRRMIAVRRWESEALGEKGVNGRYTKAPEASVRVVAGGKEYMIRGDDDIARYPIEDAPPFARGKLVGEEFY